jgi:hypothetical protein
MVHNFPLNSAAAAAWRIDAPAARVPIERAGAVFTVENDPRVARLFQPGPARDSVKFNIVAGVYPGARPAAIAGEFCAHALNCHIWPHYQFELIHNQSKRNHY